MTAEAVIAGHVSLDVFPQLFGPLDLEPGRLTVVGPARFSTGGVVSNTGLAMHRLGVPVRLVGKVGDDLFGRFVGDAYRELDPQLIEGLTISPDEPTSYTIVINPPQRDRAYLHCPGANESFGAEDVRDDQLVGARLFHFGYPPLMPRMYADGGAELRGLFDRAQAAGLVTALDMCVPDPASAAGRADWSAVLAAALPAVDIFAPSIEELLFMVDRERFARLVGGESLVAVVDRACLLELSDMLIAMGSLVIAIKLGELGLYLRACSDHDRIEPLARRLGSDPDAWRGREVLAPCFQADRVLGTTGSGDATIAGLLTAALRGASAADAATIATAVGACSVEAVDPTTGIPSWDRLARRLTQDWRRHDVEIDFGSATLARESTGTLVLR